LQSQLPEAGFLKAASAGIAHQKLLQALLFLYQNIFVIFEMF
jgi:hypothetical protein